MVGFWIYKFQKNDDVSTIEYQYVTESSDLSLPEMTICIGRETFADENLNLGDYIDIRDYVQLIQPYKTGRDPAIERINFTWSNNFNGFWNSYFCKCYGFEIDSRLSSNSIQIDFKPELSNLLLEAKSITPFVVFNYPRQFLRNLQDVHVIWDTVTNTTTLTRFKINAVEVVVRRNRPNSPCFTEWKNYDNSMFEKHKQEANCTVPYQVQNKPLCNTSEEIWNSAYSINQLRNKYFPPPCQEMSGIVSSMNILKTSHTTSPALVINYPDKIKVITQIKSVDFHTLIGNIGGYIGLFLGNIFQRLIKQH